MTVDRRDFLKGAAATGAATACVAAAGTVAAPSSAEARPNLEMPPEAIGLLFDSTLCVGCKACVAGCKQANAMPMEYSTPEQLWDTPLDISGKTLNVIKAYTDGTMAVKDREKDGYAYIKKSCYHCVDPSCVSACPVSAMTKDKTNGIVGYDSSICIGCRYCVAACPYNVPRFTYDTPVPVISKCQLCKHRLAQGQIPACAEVCPTGATIFGTVKELDEEVARRKAMVPGEKYEFTRRTLHTGDTHEKAAPQYLDHVYGEKELGGTQVKFLSAVPFEKLDMPTLPERSYASISEGIQHTLYKGMIAPLAVLGGLLFAAKRTADKHKDEEMD